jgi:hypothetical protein
MLVLPIVMLGSGALEEARAETRAQVPSASSVPIAAAGDALVMRVYFRDLAERDRLATELAADEVSTLGNYITVTRDQALFDSLKARGLRVEVDREATKQVNDPNIFAKDGSDTFYNGYHTVEEIYGFLDQKVTDFPNLAEKIDIGDSWCKTHPGICTRPNTWGGFDLYVLHITNRSIPGPKPVFWYDAGIHSREIATPEVAMRFIDYLLNGYNTDADARWIVDYQDLWIMPTLNPDGHHMNESNGQGSPTLHRKNADQDDGCNTYDQFGTDINRNFDFQWGCCGGSSPDPCSDIYRGPSPNSEDETQAVAAKISALIPDQRGPQESDPAPITTTGTLINMHSNARQNLYPWGYTTSYAPNRTDLRNIGRHMSSPQVVPPGNGYEYCQNVECLYIVDGDEKNWAYGELGIPAYSLELTGNSFFPPYACIDNGYPGLCSDSSVGSTGIWQQNRGALLYHAKIARTPYLLTRGPDANNSPSVPITVTQGDPAVVTATMNYNWRGAIDNQVNAYLQNVAAAEYYIDTPPWAGGTAQPMNATDGTFDSPTENVDASVPTGSLSLGRHVVFMRGRGVTDYEGFQSWGPISAVFLDVVPTGGSTSTPTSTAIATTAPTNTPTSTPSTPGPATATPTGTAIPTSPAGSVTATPTFPSPPCGALPQTSSASCSSPSTYNYSFTFYVESGCSSATGTATLTFEVAEVSGGPFTTFDQQARPVTFPHGPTYVTFSGTLTETNIPAQYNYFRVNFASNVIPNAYAQTAGGALCGTGTPTPSPTVCPITFTDVPVGSTFYEFIRCLACTGIINGYPDGTFKPNNNVTRGQLSKIVSNSAGFSDPATQMFEDVAPGSTFFDFIGRLAVRGYISGYACGGIGEPCVPPGNLPYFRPNANATRGQISKIVSNAAGFQDPVTGQTFQDVPPGSTFYDFIERLASRGVMSGYPCGSVPTEPCVPPDNRPYFRPSNNATRGQTSKIVANTFFPDCNPPTARK